MIAHLHGRVLSKRPSHAVVDVNGVGYEIAISVPTFSELPNAGGEVSLHIHTHVREDALSLYGFLRPQEKELFERLLGVSGIGPKLAITVLSGMRAEQMVAAIRGNDVAMLTRIPGIGKKTAERMVLELRDRLEQFAATATAPSASPLEEDVLSALTNLGYSRALAERALGKIAGSQNGNAKSFDALFREALAVMSK